MDVCSALFFGFQQPWCFCITKHPNEFMDRPEETGNPEIGRGDFDAEGDATRKIGRMKVGCLKSS